MILFRQFVLKKRGFFVAGDSSRRSSSRYGHAICTLVRHDCLLEQPSDYCSRGRKRELRFRKHGKPGLSNQRSSNFYWSSLQIYTCLVKFFKGSYPELMVYL